MPARSRYVVTTRTDKEQTFVFDGDKTIDEIFNHVAARTRDDRFSALSETHKIFSVSISRDESAEPTAMEKIEKSMSQFGFLNPTSVESPETPQ